MGDSILLRHRKVNSVGLAILLCANPLSWVYPTNNVIVLISLISFVLLIANNKLKTFFNNKLLLVFGVLILFLFSYVFGAVDPEKYPLYFLSFLAFGFTGILYANVRFDYATFYKAIFVISLLAVPGLLSLIQRDYSSMAEATGVWMGISQGALRLILGLILVLSVFKNFVWKGIAILGIVFYLFFYFEYGTRGAILALVVFLLFVFLERRKLLKTSTFIFLALLGIVFSFFFVDIALFVQRLLQDVGIEVKAIDKVIRLSQSNLDITNGRIQLWSEALRDIYKHPVFGYGVSAYDRKYGIYPHNFFIQILYEGGIVYFLPILLIFFKGYKLVASKHFSSEGKRFINYLFCAGLIELLFSNTYWRNMFFWFFLAFIIDQKRKTTSTKPETESVSERPEYQRMKT